MWSRFRRRSFSPNRPVVFPEQWPLLVVSLLAIVLGLAIVVALLV